MRAPNVLGLTFSGAGVAIIASCVRDMAHCNVWIVGAGCVMLTVGALIIDPTPVLAALKSLAEIAGQYLPTRKPGGPA